MVVRRLGEKSPPEAARVSGQEATMSFSGPTDPPFTLPEPYPFKEQVIIDVMFPGQCGNTAFFFKSQPDQFHFEFRGIVFPGKSFFSAHEVSTCKNKWVLKLQDPGFGTRRYSDDAYRECPE